MSFRLIARVRVPVSTQATGYTIHRDAEGVIPVPAELQIIQMDGDVGLNLEHLDADGNWMTDTYHETVADAIAQAKLEFDIGEKDWEVTPGA